MKNFVFIFIFSGISLTALTGNPADMQLIAHIKVEAGNFDRYQTPVSLTLDSLTGIDASQLVLYEVRDNERVYVPVQFSYDGRRHMHWQLNSKIPAGSVFNYELVKGSQLPSDPGLHIKYEEGTYTFLKGNQPVLRYNAATVYAPAEAQESFKRSGFIHPLYAPDGTILTNIQPTDHMHHYGIWNPWTRTTFRGEDVDFWNLRKEQGTVKHAGVVSRSEGPVFAALEVMHEHIAWPESTRQTRAMNERNMMKVYNHNENVFVVDFEFHIIPDEDIVLEEYRYGGFVFRGTADWNNKTSGFITSEGLDRDHADGQRAYWCVVDGKTNSGNSGIFFMGNPDNYNHPEPLRVWPSDANQGNGDVFINFSPTRNTSWNLQAHDTYVLKYRMLVFSGEMETNEAEKIWNDYANSPRIIWETK